MKETFRTPGKRHRREQGEGALFKRADGMWEGRVELVSPDGIRRRKRVYSRDKATCIDKLEALKRQIADGYVPSSKRVKTSAWMDEWMKNVKRPEVSPRQYANHRSTIKQHITPVIGDKPLVAVTSAHIRLVVRSVVDKGLTTRTARSVYDVLNMAFDGAKKEGLVPVNVVEAVRAPGVLHEKRGHLAAGDVRKLTESMGRLSPESARWATYLYTGARQAEVLGLQWDRVDFDEGTIDISWSLGRLPLKKGHAPTDPGRYDVRAGFEYRPLWGGYALVRPKTRRSIRLVPMIPELETRLREYREHATPNDFGLVWAAEATGRPLRSVADTAAWKAALKKAGVPEVTVHGARHTTNTLLQELGVPEDVRMAIAGHSTEAAQRIYAEVDLKRARLELEKLGKAIEG